MENSTTEPFNTANSNVMLYDVVFSKSDGKTQFEKLY